MTERLLRRFVDLLLENGLISKAEYEDFVYVLLGDVESLMVITSILFLSIMIGQIIPTVGFLICFFALRKRTGGYHLDSYFKCYIGTLCLYIIITIIAYITFECTEILLGSAMIAMAVIMLYGSINHPDMDMENDELQESKMMSRIIVGMEFSVILFLKWLGNVEMLVAYSSLAIVLCAILLVLAKLTGQEVKKV